MNFETETLPEWEFLPEADTVLQERYPEFEWGEEAQGLVETLTKGGTAAGTMCTFIGSKECALLVGCFR